MFLGTIRHTTNLVHRVDLAPVQLAPNRMRVEPPCHFLYTYALSKFRQCSRWRVPLSICIYHCCEFAVAVRRYSASLASVDSCDSTHPKVLKKPSVPPIFVHHLYILIFDCCEISYESLSPSKSCRGHGLEDVSQKGCATSSFRFERCIRGTSRNWAKLVCFLILFIFCLQHRPAPSTRYLKATHDLTTAPKSSVTASTLALGEQYILGVYARPPFVLSHGRGSWVWDTEDRKFLDFSAGIAVNALGHADPGVAEVSKSQPR